MTKTPHRRASRLRDSGVSDIIGGSLLVGITVIVAAGFGFIILNLPPPQSDPHAILEAFVDPSNADRIIIEHRGGLVAPLRKIVTGIGMDDSAVRENVGDRLAAGDPAWSVLGSDGALETADGTFGPGDQIRYTNAAVRGKRIDVAVVYDDRGAVALGPINVQVSDTSAPTIRSARTTSTTTLQVTFTEAIDTIAASDFTVSGVTISSVRLIGNNSIAEFTTTAFSSSATPTVSSVASPAGTRDLAGLLLVGGVSVVAKDGAAPVITGPTATAGASTATIAWTTDEASDSRVEFGPTPSLGRTVSDTGSVTSHSIGLSGLSPGTLYYYRVSSADAAGNRRTSATVTLSTIDLGKVGVPTFSIPVVNVIYTSSQAKEASAAIGMNIINPTSSPISVDLVRFTTSPTFGGSSDDKFFRGTLTQTAGSDSEFSCTWSGSDSDSITCNPSGTFSVPAKGMKHVVVSFTTTKHGSDAHTIVTGEAVVTSPSAATFSSATNVRHQGSGLHMELFALSGSGGTRTAGHVPAAGGSPMDFHYRWTDSVGDAKLSTRFIIPSGWTALSVPSQSSLSSLSVIVRQPTPTSVGYVDVAQDLTAGSRDFFFRVTPPAGADSLVMQVDHNGSKEGSTKLSFQDLYWFGVTLT